MILTDCYLLTKMMDDTRFIFILAWAEQRGFHTAKAGRPDTYRAGEDILLVLKIISFSSKISLF